MLLPWVTPDEIRAQPGAVAQDGWLTDQVNEFMLDRICAAASAILYRLSGRQFAQGGKAFVRPTRINRDCGCMPWWYASWGGWGSAWSLYNGQGFPEGWYCGCKSDAELILPGPVQISKVVVSGVELQPGIDYVLLNKRRLVRMQAGTPPVVPNNNLLVWPCCQDLTLPENSQGCWYIQYFWGQPIPADGQLAALDLATELCKAFAGDSTCSLPSRTTSIARQGITALVADPLTFLEKGLTGIPTVDLFIISANPYGLRRRASVISPDTVAIEETPPYQEMVSFEQPIMRG